MYESLKYLNDIHFSSCIEGDARPQNLEPHKCHGWDSYSWDELSRYAENSKNESKNEKNVLLFGPLSKLVEERPRVVLDFINRCGTVIKL